MKFRIPAYLLLALLAAGCSQSASDIPGELGAPIEFAAPVVVVGAAGMSRAQMLDVLPEGGVFGVLGYCVPVTTLTGGDGAASSTSPAYPDGALTWAEKKASVTADVMYDQPIKFDGTKCVYRDADDKYYEPARWYTSTTTAPNDPDTYRYTFIAYHPYGEGYFTLPAEDAVGAPKIRFTMPFGSGEETAAPLDPDIVHDAMMATVTDHMRTQGTVALRFTHMLCGLRFQINNYNTSDPVTIHSVTLSGSFYRSGTVDYTPEEPTLTVDPDDTYTGTFTIASGDQTVPANSSAVIGLSDTQPRGTAVLLLPDGSASEGTYLGRGKRLTIEYFFQSKEKQTWVLDDFTIGRRPVQGDLYTVNLSFIGRQLAVTFNSAADGDTWTVDPDYDGDITIN